MVMSEAVFTTFILAALLLGEHCARRGPRWSSVAGLGVAIAGAVFTRAVGLILVPALVLRFALRWARPHALPVLSGALLVVSGLLAGVLLFTPVSTANLLPQRYVREIETRWMRGGQNQATGTQRSGAERFVRYGVVPAAEGLHKLLVPIGGGAREEALGRRLGLERLPMILNGALAALVLIGIWDSLRSLRLTSTALAFELVYLASLLAWSRPDARLFYPIQPFLAYQLLAGVGWLARGVIRPPRRAVRLVVATWAALVSLSAFKSSQVIDSRQFVRDFRVGTEWLRAHSAADALVMTHEPAIIHLYAARQTVDVPALHSADDLARFVDEQHVDYVLLGPQLEWDFQGRLWYDAGKNSMLPLLTELVLRGRAEAVYESRRDKVLIYRVRASAASP
jgi:hypothetical protein